jgi:hypothetical protein
MILDDAGIVTAQGTRAELPPYFYRVGNQRLYEEQCDPDPARQIKKSCSPLGQIADKGVSVLAVA